MTRLLAALLTVFLVLHSGTAALAASGGPLTAMATGAMETVATIQILGHYRTALSENDGARPDGLGRCCGGSVFHGHDGGHCLDDCGYFAQLADFAFAHPAQALSATAPGAATGGAGSGPYRPPIH